MNKLRASIIGIVSLLSFLALFLLPSVASAAPVKVEQSQVRVTTITRQLYPRTLAAGRSTSAMTIYFTTTVPETVVLSSTQLARLTLGGTSTDLITESMIDGVDLSNTTLTLGRLGFTRPTLGAQNTGVLPAGNHKFVLLYTPQDAPVRVGAGTLTLTLTRTGSGFPVLPLRFRDRDSGF